VFHTPFGVLKMKMVRYSYRKKGKYADKTAKIVIEKREGKEINMKQLPKPEKMWFALKRLKMIEGLRDEKNPALSEPKVHKVEVRKCNYCPKHYKEYQPHLKSSICPICLHDFRQEVNIE
jgi:hypothetical protein